MLRKSLLIFIKYIPLIQMGGIFLLYYLNLDLNAFTGNSILFTVLLLICSHVFKFCLLHRIIIICNLISLFYINIKLLFLFYVIIGVTFIVSRHVKSKNKNSKESVAGSNKQY